MSNIVNAGDKFPFFLEAGAWFTASGGCEVIIDRGARKIRQKIHTAEQQIGPFLKDAQVLIEASALTTLVIYPAEAWVPASQFAATTGAARVGADDGASGSLWTTVAGFVARIISSAGSSVVGFIAAGAGAVFRWAQDKLRETVTLEDFGAVGNGVTDDRPAFLLALAYLQGLGKGKIKLLAKTYLVSAAVDIPLENLTIEGEGNGSLILTNSATAHVFTSTNRRNLLFKSFSVWSTVTKSAGAAFAFNTAQRCRWRDVIIGPQELVEAAGVMRMFNGIDLDLFDYCVVDAGQINTSNEGIACNGNPSSLAGAGLFLLGGLKIGGQSTGAGVHIGGGAGGVTFDGVDIIANLYNVKISTERQPGVRNREVLLGSTVALDGAGLAGLYVAADSCVYLHITGTWICSSGGTDLTKYSIEVESPNAELRLMCTGVRLFNSNGGGAWIKDARVFSFTGGHVGNNGGTVTDRGAWVTATAYAVFNTVLQGGTRYICIVAHTSAASFATDLATKWRVYEGLAFKLASTLPKFNISGVSIFENGGTVEYAGAFDSNRIIDNNVGYVAPNADKVITGFTTLGTGGPSIKTKKLTGTTGAAGSGVSVAHGLNSAKIISYTAQVNYGATDAVDDNRTVDAGNEFGTRFDSANFIVELSVANSAGVASKPFTILVWYEA